MNPEKQHSQKNRTPLFGVIGLAVIAVVLFITNTWTVQNARRSTEEAVHSVSDFYLRELAGRREQVVASNLSSFIKSMYAALGQLDEQDRSDMARLQAFQARMKQLYELEKFAFVDTNGLIYTALGTQDNIGDYAFDYQTIEKPEISVKDLDSGGAKVIIAAPSGHIPFQGQTLSVCFMEIDIHKMLDGLSLQTGANSSTFCNLYYANGLSLTDVVLGGQAEDPNLLAALRDADFDPGSSLERMTADFAAGREGGVSFTFQGASQNMYYTPVEGTNWMLTYLIHDSIITDQMNTIAEDIIRRGLIQAVITSLVMFAVCGVIFQQSRRADRLAIEKANVEAESRRRQRELVEWLDRQKQLLEQERQKRQADAMITAMASDYRSVYYVDLDRDEGVCFRADARRSEGVRQGDSFPYLKTMREYAQRQVAEADRPGFLQFCAPDNIRRRLEKEKFISHRYLTIADGKEHYDLLRVAGVRRDGEPADSSAHEVGIGFADVDRETREDMQRRRALSDALSQAEEANAAKTSFLSSMSHEIRTPMNAIIGLNSIALKDPNLPARTREHLEKIRASAKHLLSLINDILDMSRIESGRMTIRNEEFSFREMLEQINTMINGQCQEKGLRFDCVLRGHVDDYYIGDDMKLKQVLINILGNAVKFTPPGGTVSFTVEPVAQFEGNATLRFVMRDTGVGMDPAFLPKIFDAFSQEDVNKANKYGSTGLGMAITKNIVEMMNGSITVESEKGAGSTFTVTVTLRTSGKSAQDGAAWDIQPQDMRVLIIDDDPVACEHAKLVLEEVGITSEACHSGKEAYELLRVAKARARPFNLILVDLKMPGEDGVAVTRNIRRLYDGETAIIILTAYSWDDIIEEALDAGVDSFMAKPLFASGVVSEFKRAILQKQADLSPAPRADLAGKRILLAEDMVINAEIMMEVLGMRKMEVDHAENGQAAVDLFAQSRVYTYDAILMDVRMPVLDGLGAAQAIRAMNRPDAKEIPIIALTANAFDEDVQRSLQAGMNAHLSKPVEPEHLYATLERMIRIR